MGREEGIVAWVAGTNGGGGGGGARGVVDDERLNGSGRRWEWSVSREWTEKGGRAEKRETDLGRAPMTAHQTTQSTMMPPLKHRERLMAPHALLRLRVGHPYSSDEALDRLCRRDRRRTSRCLVGRLSRGRDDVAGNRAKLVGGGRGSEVRGLRRREGHSHERPTPVATHGVFLVCLEGAQRSEKVRLGGSNRGDPFVFFFGRA